MRAGGLNEPEPVRIEFFGDQIESIRVIDLDTQRSTRNVREVAVAADRPRLDPEGTELLLNLLRDTILFLKNPSRRPRCRRFFESTGRSAGLYPFRRCTRPPGVYGCGLVGRFSTGTDCDIMGISSAQQFEHKTGAVWSDRRELLEGCWSLP